MILSATVRWTGSRLLGHEHHAHAAFADLLQQLVRPDDRAGAFDDRRLLVDGGIAAKGRLLQKAARLGMGAEQGPHAPLQFLITLAELCEPLVPLVGRHRANQLDKDFFGAAQLGRHGHHHLFRLHNVMRRGERIRPEMLEKIFGPLRD